MTTNSGIYTGHIQYKDIDFNFVFDGQELKLITPKDKLNEVRLWYMDKVRDRLYILCNPCKQVILETAFLEGICDKINEKIILIPFDGQLISDQSSFQVFYIHIKAYIIKDPKLSTINTMVISCTELDYIYSIKNAFNINNPWTTNDEITIKVKKNNDIKSKKQIFKIDNKEVVVDFGISSSVIFKDGHQPLSLHSAMIFHFEDTSDYIFLYELWYIAKSFIQFLCYRDNINIPRVELFYESDGKYSKPNDLYITNEKNDEELSAMDKGRYINISYLEGNEGKILNDIANDTLYRRHLPDNFEKINNYDESRFIMITSAFEWEFKRLYPNGITKTDKVIKAENAVTSAIEKLIDENKGDIKNIYKYLKKRIKDESLKSKIVLVGKDNSDILNIFGEKIYGCKPDYSEIGQRIADQRNHFAHGDLDKDFINSSLMDIVFMERIVYIMQLKYYGISDISIKNSINKLFHCGLSF